jgi:hypothetical protein
MKAGSMSRKLLLVLLLFFASCGSAATTAACYDRCQTLPKPCEYEQLFVHVFSATDCKCSCVFPMPLDGGSR